MIRLRPATANLDPPPVMTDDDIRASYAFPETRPWVRGSIVATLDGVIRGTDGTSRSIASPADQRVFSMLRAAADVVLVGAGTLRDENYRPSRLPLAIVTRSLDLPMSLRVFADRAVENPRPIVLTTTDARRRAPKDLLAAADVIPCGDEEVDLGVAIGTLAERDLRRIHCEGGPSLLADLAAADLLDELLLTVTPTLHGGAAREHLLTVPGGLVPPLRLQTTQVLEEDGSVFIRASRPAGHGAA